MVELVAARGPSLLYLNELNIVVVLLFLLVKLLNDRLFQMLETSLLQVRVAVGVGNDFHVNDCCYFLQLL